MHVGSSPLARGTLEHRPHIKAAPGLIPARAGNTSFPNDGAGIPWAHPRSRGEHEPCLCTQGSRRGSSPLARGTRSRPATPTSKSGLIPARAGNTWCWYTEAPVTGAHPRSRGEHVVLVHGGSGDWGSSPLARGTPLIPAHQAAAVGLIPARAGNTIFSRFSTVPAWAHPRSRGEHGRSHPHPQTRKGSSPLARGTRFCGRLPRTGWGLIPARAGNTPVLSPCTHSQRAHPRSRGEH